MSPHLLPAFRRRASGTPNVEFACGDFGKTATYFIDSAKTKNIFRRSFLLTFFLLLPASRGHAQTAAELQDHAAKQASTSDTWPQQAVRGSHAMVTTDETLGSQAGPTRFSG
jgi:hypothetical protein